MSYFQVLIDDGEKIIPLSFRQMNLLNELLKKELSKISIGDTDRLDDCKFITSFIFGYISNFSEERVSIEFFGKRQESYKYLNEFLKITQEYLFSSGYDLKDDLHISVYEFINKLDRKIIDEK